MNKAAIFIFGLLLGFAASLGVAYALSERYAIHSTGPSGIITIRTDKWTGKTWMQRYYEDEGSKIFYWEPMEKRE